MMNDAKVVIYLLVCKGLGDNRFLFVCLFLKKVKIINLLKNLQLWGRNYIFVQIYEYNR